MELDMENNWEEEFDIRFDNNWKKDIEFWRQDIKDWVSQEIEKAREEGRQEREREIGDEEVDVMKYAMSYADQIRQEERQRIISLIEGMKFTFKRVEWGDGISSNEPVERDDISLAGAEGYNQALKAIKNKINENHNE